MKLLGFSLLILGCGATAASAFVIPPAAGPGGRRAAAAVRSSCPAVGPISIRRSDDEVTESKEEGKVYFAGEVVEDGKKSEFQERFYDTGTTPTEETAAGESENYGPTSYEGLTDGDTFDGGDGQTGVVGDGKLNLDSFETNAVIESRTAKDQVIATTFVKESKARQMNAWGSSTGYADELKNKGFEDVSGITGQDMLEVRRQQLENWRNQQELQAQQRAKISQLESITGETVGSGWKKGSNKNYLGAMDSQAVEDPDASWNQYKPKPVGTKLDGTEWEEIKVEDDFEITDTVDVLSERGRPGTSTINLKNPLNTFEPFHCQFIGESTGFDCEPKQGTLNRRSGDPIPLKVIFKSNEPGVTKVATLVVETEEGDKWYYKINGQS